MYNEIFQCLFLEIKEDQAGKLLVREREKELACWGGVHEEQMRIIKIPPE